MQGLSTSNAAATMLQVNQMKDPAQVLSRDHERIEDAAREFEAVFFSEMMKPMFEGIDVDDTFGGGKGEEIFRGLIITEYGKAMADKDITGIQTQVKSKLIELQEYRETQQP